MDSPAERRIFQRQEDGKGNIVFNGRYEGQVINGTAAVYVRAIVREGFSGTDTDWVKIGDVIENNKNITGELRTDSGWYDVEVKVESEDGMHVYEIILIERVGVGEVFLTYGQSNSGCSGDIDWNAEPFTAKYDNVSTTSCNPDANEWFHCKDPLPSIHDTRDDLWDGEGWHDQGMGGSWMPVLGTFLAEQLGVPIGFIMAGSGGKPVSDLEPGGEYYHRLSDALAIVGKNGARAILWHQGESDGFTDREAYKNSLKNIINQTAADTAHWDNPIGFCIAGATWTPPWWDRENPESNPVEYNAWQTRMETLRTVQYETADEILQAFRGPNTDILELEYRADQSGSWVHFNIPGLIKKAELWYDVLIDYYNWDNGIPKTPWAP